MRIKQDEVRPGVVAKSIEFIGRRLCGSRLKEKTEHHRCAGNRSACSGHWPSPSLRPYVIAKQHVLVAQVELAVGNDGMRPVGCVAAVGLLEPAALEIFLGTGLDQKHGSILGTVIEPAVGECDG